MLLLKKKRIYTSPKTVVTEADLEGLICSSVEFRMQVDEIHYINADPEAAAKESLYFEF